MAEMEQEGAPAPAEGAPQAQGGGVAEKFVEADKLLSQIAQASANAGAIPDEAKAAFAQASEVFRQGLQLMMEAVKGGGRPGAAAPEAGGAPGAVPASPAGVRR